MRGDKSFLGILPSDNPKTNLEIKRDHAGYMISKGVDELWQANLRPEHSRLKTSCKYLIKNLYVHFQRQQLNMQQGEICEEL